MFALMRTDHSQQLAAGLLALAVLLAPARPALAAGGGAEFMQSVDGYEVHMTLAGKLVPGVVPVEVHLSDEQGLPVRLAQVNVVHTYLDALVEAAHAAADTHSSDDTHAARTVSASDSHDTGDTHSSHSGMVMATGTPATTSGDSHTHTEPGVQDESVPHTHDSGVLFELAAGDQAGAYTGSVIFFEAGQYGVNVVFTIDGQAHTARFFVDVRAPDAGGAVLAVFAGLNVAIIGAAAVIKRKSAAA
jgi:hypothetical protein